MVVVGRSTSSHGIVRPDGSSYRTVMGKSLLWLTGIARAGLAPAR